jgi:hypothetical protein
MATTPDHDLPQSEHLPGTPGGRIGLIVGGSLAAGLFAALALVAAPFTPAKEGVLTGVVLLGFAFGWALLAVLSVRLSDQPQGWAAAPAVFFALAGLISLSARLGCAEGVLDIEFLQWVGGMRNRPDPRW